MNFPGGTIVYIRQNGPSVQYKTKDIDWTNVSFPVTVTNTNTSLGLLILDFTTNIEVLSTNDFFLCNSSYIQFGNSNLLSDGTRVEVTVGVDNYDGFIENGSASSFGNSNIYIYNIFVKGGVYSTQIGAGWIGKKWFGTGASNNYIVNCSSTGNLPSGATGSGGIVGGYAGFGAGSTLYLIGCSSFGDIGQNSGGIIGGRAGDSGGSVTCKQCYSMGAIDNLAGGITGSYAGSNGGNILIQNCYSSGFINTSAGGIVGSNSGENGTVTVTNCYSLGTISEYAGGIYGEVAGFNGTTLAENCYSNGFIVPSFPPGPNRGIYGANKVNGLENKCYSSNNSWADSDAKQNLNGTPSQNIGSIWVSVSLNTPYELNNMGYTPYNQENISVSGLPSLVQSFNQSINVGSTSSSALVNGKAYQILAISKGGTYGSYPTITINSTTGKISTTSATESGIYTLYIRNTVYNTDDYSITQFNLTINSPNDLQLLLLLLLLRKYRRRRLYPWLSTIKI